MKIQSWKQDTRVCPEVSGQTLRVLDRATGHGNARDRSNNHRQSMRRSKEVINWAGRQSFVPSVAGRQKDVCRDAWMSHGSSWAECTFILKKNPKWGQSIFSSSGVACSTKLWIDFQVKHSVWNGWELKLGLRSSRMIFKNKFRAVRSSKKSLYIAVRFHLCSGISLEKTHLWVWWSGVQDI